MTRDRDQQPRRAASADDAFLEVTGARAKSPAPRTNTSPGGTSNGTSGESSAEAGSTDAEDHRPTDQDAQPGELPDARDVDETGETGAGQVEPPPAGALNAAGHTDVPDDQDHQDDQDDQNAEPGPDAVSPAEVRDRLRRRAIFLRELAEARELRQRVTPHRSRRARIHAALRRRTFRLH